MSTHKICYEELEKKIIPELSSKTHPQPLLLDLVLIFMNHFTFLCTKISNLFDCLLLTLDGNIQLLTIESLDMM